MLMYPLLISAAKHNFLYSYVVDLTTIFTSDATSRTQENKQLLLCLQRLWNGETISVMTS